MFFNVENKMHRIIKEINYIEIEFYLQTPESMDPRLKNSEGVANSSLE